MIITRVRFKILHSPMISAILANFIMIIVIMMTTKRLMCTSQNARWVQKSMYLLMFTNGICF